MKSFPHLETFLEAAERGTFAAGRALGVTQAAVSQRIPEECRPAPAPAPARLAAKPGRASIYGPFLTNHRAA